MADTENVVVLNDSDGNPARFEFLDLIPYGGHNYVVLYPLDEEEDDGQVVVLMVDEDPNVTEESYVSVEDDAVVQAVYQIFKEKNKDSFNFQDGASVTETPVTGGKRVKCRARLGVLFIAWLGAWVGLHLNWMGYHEAAKNFRRSMGGIFCIINPVCWIMHVVEVIKVLFGGYRQDANGRPIRYFAFLRNLGK